MRNALTWITRFVSRRRPSIVEQLEEIEEELLSLETSRDNSLHLEKRLVFGLYFYAVILFGISFIAIYYFWPVDQSRRTVMLLYILGYPLAVTLMKWLLCGFFHRRIRKADGRLKYLKERKQKLLEEVMETEVFNKAQKILKRFDPLSFASQTARTAGSTLSQAPVSPTDADVRQRKLNQAGGDSPTAPPSLVARSPGAPIPPAAANSTTPAEQRPRLLRPILPKNRTFVDRIVDVIIGDGPDRRFALICQQCNGHNGMALKEEFEFIAFCCCYCSHHNPSRRSRQRAPVPPNIEVACRSTATVEPIPTKVNQWRSSPNLAVVDEQLAQVQTLTELSALSTSPRKRSFSVTRDQQAEEPVDVVALTDSSGTDSEGSTAKVTPQAVDSV